VTIPPYERLAGRSATVTRAAGVVSKLSINDQAPPPPDAAARWLAGLLGWRG
jgi:hypothetical protein